MNVSQNAMTNAVNLSFLMVNLSYRLLQENRIHNPNASVLDLKAYFRGHQYVEETIKMLPEKPEPVLLDQIFDRIASLGRINAPKPCVLSL